MNRDKQIEEMRKTVAKIHRFFLEDDDCKILDDYIADELYAEGYRKASEVAREIFGMLRIDLKGEVDMEYLERLLTIYEKKFTEGER